MYTMLWQWGKIGTLILLRHIGIIDLSKFDTQKFYCSSVYYCDSHKNLKEICTAFTDIEHMLNISQQGCVKKLNCISKLYNKYCEKKEKKRMETFFNGSIDVYYD
jgi:hypothetical protein